MYTIALGNERTFINEAIFIQFKEVFINCIGGLYITSIGVEMTSTHPFLIDYLLLYGSSEIMQRSVLIAGLTKTTLIRLECENQKTTKTHGWSFYTKSGSRESYQ